MFETVQQESRPGATVYLTSLAVSVVIHGAIIAVLLIVPLVFLNAIQAEELLTLLIEPPPPPVPPPPPAPPMPAAAENTRRTVTYNGDLAPPEIPHGIPAAPDAEPIQYADVLAKIPGMIVSGQAIESPGIGGIPGLVVAEAKPMDPPKRPPSRQIDPVRVGDLQQSKLIYRVNPIYPDLARRARVYGDVILEAMIDEEGNVASIKVLRGHPLLNDAAVVAVRQWKYSPTVLSGEPVPVIATITVIFRLNN